VIVVYKQALTNHVPAVAVKHEAQALSILIGRKGYVGGQKSFFLLQGFVKKKIILLCLSYIGVYGTSYLAVMYVEI